MQAQMHLDLRGRELAHRLRAARETAGFSGNEISKALGMSQGQLSRIESAQRRASFLHTALLLGMYNVPPAERDEILDLVATGSDDDEAARRHGCWVRPHRGGPPESVATVRFAYDTATTIICCDSTSIPALVQTDEFIEADVRRLCGDEADQPRWIEARRQHQSILFNQPGPSLTCYLHEARLPTLPVEDEVLQTQFIRLAMLIGQERLHLRIVPAEVDGALMGVGFSWMRFAEHKPVVCVPCDTVTLITEGQDLTTYRERLAALDGLALSEKDSQAIVMDLVGRPTAGREVATVSTELNE